MHCLEDQNLMPHCVSCTMRCPPYDNAAKSSITNPSKLVCGTDGITYRNLCDIKRAACLSGRSIPVAYRGPCKGKILSSFFKSLHIFFGNFFIISNFCNYFFVCLEVH